MLQASLIDPIAKLDIKDLLKPSHSPPPSQPAQPSSYTRSNSVPSSYSKCNPLPSPSSTSTTSRYSAPTAPPNVYTQFQNSSQLPAQSNQLSSTAQAVFHQNPNLDPAAESTACNKRSLPADEESVGSPAKRQSKWSPAEDAKLIRLRAKGMKWDDISKELLGRSAISCRLHYQNYLERRSEWDEEKKNKLARVYDRLKPDLWNPIAIELGVPWRAAEAMHWALGEQDMARRANVAPFQINATRPEHLKPGNGRVAQRDRMLESTRVFEGRDLNSLSSPFSSVSGNGLGHHQSTPCGPTYSVPPPAHVHLAPIKSEQDFNGYDEDEPQCKEDDDEDGTKAPKRRSGIGGTRLPGLAELDGGVQAIAERERCGFVMVDRFEGRRGSGGSSGSNGSSGSGGSR